MENAGGGVYGPELHPELPLAHRISPYQGSRRTGPRLSQVPGPVADWPYRYGAVRFFSVVGVSVFSSFSPCRLQQRGLVSDPVCRSAAESVLEFFSSCPLVACFVTGEIRLFFQHFRLEIVGRELLTARKSFCRRHSWKLFSQCVVLSPVHPLPQMRTVSRTTGRRSLAWLSSQRPARAGLGQDVTVSRRRQRRPVRRRSRLPGCLSLPRVQPWADPPWSSWVRWKHRIFLRGGFQTWGAPCTHLRAPGSVSRAVFRLRQVPCVFRSTGNLRQWLAPAR